MATVTERQGCSPRTVTVVRSGVGNLGSLVNVLGRLGTGTVLTDDPTEVRRARRLILPGVGAFDAAMKHLQGKGLLRALDQRVAAGVPILGICLGMQLLARSSEEGNHSGLGWIPATARRITAQTELPVPHVGWNTVTVVKPHALFTGLHRDARFYFSHSYHLVCDVPADVLAMTRYGDVFPSAVQRDHVIGVQFHPEKSHRYGQDLLAHFLAL